MNHDDDMPEDDTPEDTLPAMRAELDQLLMVAPELARVTRGWYDAFTDEGFNDNQALYLTAVQIKDSPGPAPS